MSIGNVDVTLLRLDVNSMELNRQKLWVSTRDYIFITIGIFVYAFGFSAFILPEKVVIGGVAGISTIVYFVSEKYLGFGFPVAATQFIINVALLSFAYRIVGRQFVLRTLFGTMMISFAMAILIPLFPQPLVQGQSFMNVLIGSIMCGIGLGLSFTHNGSTGGTDIVAAIVSKRTNVTIGRTMLYTDMCIISSSYLVFQKIDTVIYGFVVLAVVAYITDMIINTNRQAVQFTIFSPYWEEIASAINNEANRGCTVINGTGWYSKQDVKILLVMCRKIESVTIFRIVKSIDENAFITQANVNGVYGKGFDAMKLKVYPRHQDKQKQSDESDETV